MSGRHAWAAAPLCALAIWPLGTLIYQSGGAAGCARCHEIRPNFEKWAASTHRNLPCESCHGGALTLEAGFHFNNLNRLVTHLRGDTPDQLGLRAADVPRLVERCRSCHRQEFAEWQNGPHGVAYKQIFLDEKHNKRTPLRDDCLRCHAAHYQGGINDLLTPVDTAGPWRFKDAESANLPAIPCMSCHEMHREGMPSGKGRKAALRASLAHFDRREMEHVPLKALSIPVMLDGERSVRMSPDLRQALCYQCHAPLPSRQVGSADDRTGMGVHEGFSCLACHQKHGQNAAASCATCHPRLSNCGLDVEKMDTTFLNSQSKHNIHFVKCADCHPKGVPAKRARPQAAD
jgi:hypothetical protein